MCRRLAGATPKMVIREISTHKPPPDPFVVPEPKLLNALIAPKNASLSHNGDVKHERSPGRGLVSHLDRKIKEENKDEEKKKEGAGVTAAARADASGDVKKKM